MPNHDFILYKKKPSYFTNFLVTNILTKENIIE